MKIKRRGKRKKRYYDEHRKSQIQHFLRTLITSDISFQTRKVLYFHHIITMSRDEFRQSSNTSDHRNNGDSDPVWAMYSTGETERQARQANLSVMIALESDEELIRHYKAEQEKI